MLFAPSEFLERLRRNDLAPLFGLVKEPESGSDYILFTFDPSCSGWTEIPLDLIEAIEPVSTVSCRDHQHQTVRLYLKVPESPEARLFASLLAARATSAPLPTSRVRVPRRTPMFRDPGIRPFLPVPVPGLQVNDMGDCQQYAGAAQYNWIMAGYYATHGDTQLAQDFLDYYDYAKTLYAACTRLSSTLSG
jgi:hypothetical protein